MFHLMYNFSIFWIEDNENVFFYLNICFRYFEIINELANTIKTNFDIYIWWKFFFSKGTLMFMWVVQCIFSDFTFRSLKLWKITFHVFCSLKSLIFWIISLCSVMIYFRTLLALLNQQQKWCCKLVDAQGL